MKPGCTLLTRMPSLPYCTAADLVSRRTAPFGRVVAHVDEFLADEAGDRGLVDDRASPCLSHRGNGGLDAKKSAARVDRHQPVRMLRAQALVHPAADARVVDQHVQAPVARQDAVYDLDPLPLLGNIQPHELDVAAARRDRRSDFVAFALEHIGDVTLAPSRANSRAVASPMPCAPPVTSATLSLSLSVFSLPRCDESSTLACASASLADSCGTPFGDRNQTTAPPGSAQAYTLYFLRLNGRHALRRWLQHSNQTGIRNMGYAASLAVKEI